MSRFKNTKMAGLEGKLGASMEGIYTAGLKNMLRPMKRRPSISARKCLKRVSLLALTRNLSLLMLIYSRCTWTGTILLTTCSEDGRILSEALLRYPPT
jgi:hypothetical protein